MTPRALPSLLLALLLAACGSTGTEGSKDPGASAADPGVTPMGIDSYTGDAGAPTCKGVIPPPGIEPFNHEQCAGWGITECTRTRLECQALFRDTTTSQCCCSLCGVKAGTPTCFNLLCP